MACETQWCTEMAMHIMADPVFAGCQGGCPDPMTCETVTDDMLVEHAIMLSEFTVPSTLAIAWSYEDPNHESEIAVQTYFEVEKIEEFPIEEGGPAKNPAAGGPTEQPVEEELIKFGNPPEPGPIRAPANEVKDGEQTAPALSFTALGTGDLMTGEYPAIIFDIAWKSLSDATGIHGMRYQFRHSNIHNESCTDPEDGLCAPLVRQPRGYE